MTGGLGILLSGILGAALIARLILTLVRRSSQPLPPGPKPAPVIGNIHQLPKSLQWLHLYHWSKTYGPVMHLSMAGQPLVILSTHQAAHDLLNRRSQRYSDRPRMVMAGDLVTKNMHMLLRPLRAASRYRPLQDIESQQLLFDVLGEWDKFGEKGVDFHHHFERAMASTIYCLNYGYRLQTGFEKELLDGKRVQAEFARTGQLGAYMVDSFPSLNYLPGFLAPWKKEGEELYELERELHVGNLEKGLRNRSWNFARHMKGSPGAKGMPTEELAFDLGILADAGLDTSTVALDWFIVAWITSGSHWVGNAQRILDEVVGRDRMPTFEDRPKLSYIDAIANSIVLPNAFAITRDEAVFGEDVDAFIPERWFAETDGDNLKEPSIDSCGVNVSALKDLPQTGFGLGRRICTGRTIARNQLFIQMARMLWHAGERYPVDDMDCTEGFVTLPKPFRAVMRPRGQWVRDAILESGTTHGLDHAAILDEARIERS
ncbi:cytochrome P450 [Aspergillus varians]